MANVSGRARLRWKIIVPLLAVALLVSGAHLWWNTNLLGREDVCGGLVSTDSAEVVLPGSGRISDRDGLDDRPGDRLAFTCTVQQSSVLPGSDTEYLRLSGTRERGDFPFLDGRWPSPATMSFFSGGSTGAVGSDHGWVLLPDGCTTADGPAIIEGYAPEGSDPVKVARLLTEIANNAAERAGCAAEQPLTAPDTLAAAPQPRQVEDSAVCDLAGLKFPGRKGDPGVTETVQDRAAPVWSCEVTGRATYAVTQEPHILAAIRSSPGYEEQPQVAGHRVSGFDNRHVVADCAGTPTYFSMELGQDYTSAIGEPGTPRAQDLFDNFVDVAGRRFSCS
jgi:hypothetical protein